MKIKLAAAVNMRTPQGDVTLNAGAIISLPDDRALKLIQGGKALPVIPEPCQGCWAESNGNCYAKVKGLPCTDAVSSCEYQRDSYKQGRLLPDDALLSTYSAVYSAAAERINNSFYPEAYGCVQWIQEHLPQIAYEIQVIEQKLQQPLKDKIKLSEFMALVEHWEQLHCEAIRKYLQAKKH